MFLSRQFKIQNSKFSYPSHQTMSEGSAKDERRIKACAARTEG
ncbi:hypothetical protein HMPREF9075_01028 [Capnocytophaga sp. oral taxon 332 str. F0381]|nr:hypothetical protein HMPREF9075_01028 [Capnocytophaga sp. oral taxon 332 str. F0381]